MGCRGWNRIIVVLLAMIMASCGGTGGGPSDSGNQFVFSARGRLNLGVQTTDDPAKLVITATLLDPQGVPFRNAEVTFTADFPDATFIPGDDNSGKITTDDNGQASILLLAGLTTGKMRVMAEAPSSLDISTGLTVNLTSQGFVTLGALNIIPNAITFVNPAKGTTFDFAASGGVPPYRFASANPNVAKITTQGTFGRIGHYELTGPLPTTEEPPRTDTVTVQDAAGTTSTSTVTVVFAACSLRLSPAGTGTSPGTITFTGARGGEKFDITIIDGVPPYTATHTFPQAGNLTINQQTGIVTYTVPTPPVFSVDPDNVLIRDSRGCTGTVNVTVNVATSTQTITTLVLTANPTSINGVTGGTSTITATVLDENNRPIPTVSVLFTTDKGSISPLISDANANGTATTTLTIQEGTPAGTAKITGAAGGKTGTVDVAIITEVTGEAGDPADIFVDLFANGSGNNGDGTCTTIFSALVVDAEGNPVDDGTRINWEAIPPSVPAGTVVVINSPSFTKQSVPTGCDPSTYEEDTGLTLTLQPGDALTCLKYPRSASGGTAKITAIVDEFPGVRGTFDVILPPCPFTKSDLAIYPASVTMTTSDTAVFVVVGGSPPYSILANGGTASTTTLSAAGDSFTYLPNDTGTFSVIITDSVGNVVQAVLVVHGSP